MGKSKIYDASKKSIHSYLSINVMADVVPTQILPQTIQMNCVRLKLSFINSQQLLLGLLLFKLYSLTVNTVVSTHTK